ncbi:DUF5633 domain-containing protein [Aerococcus christensenii]
MTKVTKDLKKLLLAATATTATAGVLFTSDAVLAAGNNQESAKVGKQEEKETTPEKGEVSKAKTSFDQTVKEKEEGKKKKEEGKKKKEKIQKAVGLKDQKVDQVEATENNEAGFHFVVDAEQAAENALLDNGGVNKGYKIARHEYKDDKGKVKDAKFFYTLTIEEGKEKGRFEDNTQGFASKENAVKAAEKALKVDHEINTGYEINFNKRMGRYFYKLTMDGKKVVPATKVADKKKANKKVADKKDDKTAGQKAKVLPKTGAVAGSVAMLGLALVTAGSAFTFRRKK